MDRLLSMSAKELSRMEVMQRLSRKQMSHKEAGTILGLGVRQIKRLLRWVAQVEAMPFKALKSFITTLRNWWQQILNYFEGRFNNGFAEGVNLKIKMLKRRCYGIFNIKHLFPRIYLDLHGYRLFAATTIYD